MRDVRPFNASQNPSPSVIQDLSKQFADARMQSPPKGQRQQLRMMQPPSPANPQSLNVSKGSK